MKKQVLTLISVLTLLLAAGSAMAQMNTPIVKANIPFSFVVDKQALPAGTYEIGSYGSLGQALMIQGEQGNASKLVLANRADTGKPATQTKLVFRRYGDRYFLSQVWVEGNRIGRQLPKSAHEAEVARDFSSKDVIVLASLR